MAVLLAIALTLVDIRLHTGHFASPYAGNHGFRTVLPFSGRPGFSYPALFGVLAILFSLGKGLVFFAPGMFLPVRDRLASFRGLARTRVLWLVLVAGMIAVYSRWWAWYGGEFYGPRFFLVASFPASLAIATRLRPGERSLTAVAVTVGALALSLWVGVTSAMDAGTHQVCVRDDYALEHLCWYTPEFSALWRPLIDFPDISSGAAAFGMLSLCVLVRLALPVLIETRPLVSAQARGLRRTFHTGAGW